MTDKVLTFDFHAKDSASGVFREIDGSLTSLGRAGVLAAAAIAAAAVGIGVESVKAAVKFQSAMELIRTQAGASQAEVNKMSQAILNLAPKVGTGPEELAQGLYHIESAGIRGAQALDMLKTAAEGAKVGHADLESVTNALIAAVNSGIPGVQNMSGAMGTLNAIVGAGNMRMQDLTTAFSTGILSAAKVFGVSIESVGGALADMTNQGIPAVDAATRITSAMRLMAAPTTKAKKELESIGITSTQLANDMRGSGGIQSAIDDLKAHLDRSGLSLTQQAALLATAFGGKQSLGILTLVGNIGELGKATDSVTKGATSFGTAWAATQQTAEEKWADVTAAVGSLAIEIGNILLPVAYNFITAMQVLVSGISDWVNANQPLIAQIGGIFSTVIKDLGIAVGVLANIWSTVLLPALKTFWAWEFGVLIPALEKLWNDEIKPAIDTLLPALADAWNNQILPAIRTVAAFVSGTVVPALEHLWTDTIRPAIDTILPELARVFNDTILPAIKTVADWVDQHVIPVLQYLWANVITPAVDHLLPALAEAWNTILLPALQAVTSFISTDVIPLLQNLWQNWIMPAANIILPALATAFGDVVTAVQFVLDRLNDFGRWITGNKPLMNDLQTVAGIIGQAFAYAAGAVQTLLGYLGTLAQWVADHGGGVISTIGQIISSVSPGGGLSTAQSLAANAGHKAAGGPVQGGVAYVVGENGPETFVPKQNGTIIPAGGMTAMATDTAATLGLVGQANQSFAQLDTVKQQIQAIKDHIFALRNHSFNLSQHTLALREHVTALQNQATTMREHITAMRDHLSALHLHKDKLGAHIESMAIHAAELKLHAQELVIHTAQMAAHSAQMAPHAVQLAVHALEMKQHGLALQASTLSQNAHTEKMTAHAAEMVDHKAAMAAHTAALKGAATSTASSAASAASSALGKVTLINGAIPVWVTNWVGGTVGGGVAAGAVGAAGIAATGGTTISGPAVDYATSDAMAAGLYAPAAGGYAQVVPAGQSPTASPSHVEFHPGAVNVNVPQGTTAQQAQAILLELQRAMTRNSYSSLVPR